MTSSLQNCYPRQETRQSVLFERDSAAILPTSALILWKNRPSPSVFLLRSISQPNKGVLPLGLGITEISGTAGSGKTQIALGLCVSCAASSSASMPTTRIGTDSTLPRPSIHAIYISLGEGGTQARLAQRLNQMASHHHQSHHHCDSDSNSNLLHRISIRMVRNEEEFLVLLDKELPTLLKEQQQNMVGVVVLDSIAAMFRNPEVVPSEKCQYMERSTILFQVAAKLKRLSDTHQVPIVVVNQVTSTFQEHCDNVIPALGLAWASCVNTSYLLSRQEISSRIDGLENKDMVPSSLKQTAFRRELVVRRSSHSPECKIAFKIETSGVIAIE